MVNVGAAEIISVELIVNVTFSPVLASELVLLLEDIEVVTYGAWVSTVTVEPSVGADMYALLKFLAREN